MYSYVEPLIMIYFPNSGRRKNSPEDGRDGRSRSAVGEIYQVYRVVQ